jgi:hypothetical protein
MVGRRNRLAPDGEAGASLKVGLGGIVMESPLFLGEGGESICGGNVDDWSKGEPSNCSCRQHDPGLKAYFRRWWSWPTSQCSSGIIIQPARRAEAHPCGGD